MRTDKYYREFAAAYVAGRTGRTDMLPKSMSPHAREEFLLRSAPEDVIPALDKFKRKSVLDRVRRVLGFLRSIRPSSLLDIGTGRGTFLWPCMDEFKELQVSAVDKDEIRFRDLEYINKGGVGRLEPYQIDATDMYAFQDDQFEVVTALEVLEHIPDASLAAEEILRVAQRFVVVSVPSKEDNNPEHIHLFRQHDIEGMFRNAASVKFEWVRGHMLAFVRKGSGHVQVS